MSKYYISTPNGPIHYSTLQEAVNGAQKAANRWGISIGVHSGMGGFHEATAKPQSAKKKTYKKNPLFKRPPKHAREDNGFIVSYSLNGKAYRLRYANKGIATIKANDAKKNGAKSVKIVAG